MQPSDSFIAIQLLLVEEQPRVDAARMQTLHPEPPSCPLHSQQHKQLVRCHSQHLAHHGACLQDLLQKIVGLSYTGDVRMGIAEDPHKVCCVFGIQASYLVLPAVCQWLQVRLRGTHAWEPSYISP